jgi:beta-hydroxylase
MKEYEFIKEFEASWKEIYAEYLNVKNKFVDWPEKNLYNKGWEVFGLYNWPSGDPFQENVKLCPVTSKLIKSCFPKGHGTAGFSRLQPNTILKPHSGYMGNFLRAHLALEVPEGDCALKVQNTIMPWQEGKMIVFDDRLEHSAWNKTNKERVVLLVDFIEY